MELLIHAFFKDKETNHNYNSCIKGKNINEGE